MTDLRVPVIDHAGPHHMPAIDYWACVVAEKLANVKQACESGDVSAINAALASLEAARAAMVAVLS